MVLPGPQNRWALVHLSDDALFELSQASACSDLTVGSRQCPVELRDDLVSVVTQYCERRIQNDALAVALAKPTCRGCEAHVAARPPKDQTRLDRQEYGFSARPKSRLARLGRNAHGLHELVE